MKFISERYPDLHIPTIRVQFRDGVAEATSRGQIAYLLSPWMQRRGVRPADDIPTEVPAPAEPTPAIEPEPPQADPETTEPPVGDAVPEGTAADVLAWVGDDPDRARQATEAEQGREKPRTSLITRLDRIAE